MEKLCCVYILANKRNGTLYVGVTSNLIRRIQQHKDGFFPGFTKKYGVDKLVYYEIYHDIQYAIYREKRLKRWRREWKLSLIDRFNANWDDLFNKILPR